MLPNATAAAIRAFTDAHATAGVLGVAPYEAQMPAYRERLARFIGAQPGEIAMLRNTGDGATAIAQGFPWEPGDEIVTNDNEFGANAFPWLALRARGVHVRFVETAHERMTPDVLARMMTPRTKLVAVSWVSFIDGYRHDLAALAEIAHRGGAFFAVDAIQALGAFPFDVGALGVDAAYGSGAKWMLAMAGLGWLYLRSSWLDRVALALPGWRSVADIWNFLDYEQAAAPDATRFEGGTPNFVGSLALATSCDVLDDAGVPRIANHVLALTDRLVEHLRRLDAHVLSVRDGDARSGIVTFTIPGVDPVALGTTLGEAGFVTTFRPSGVRVSPHGYNTEAEIDAFAEATAAISRSALTRR